MHFDRKAMSTEQGQAVLRDICAAVPAVPWLVDASSHYPTVQSFLQRELGKAFPPQKWKVAQSYLFDATWVLKDYRVWLKKRALQSKLHSRWVDATAAFQIWRDARPFGRARWLLVAKLCLGAKRTAQYVQSLRETKSELRNALREGRSRFLSSVARQAADRPVLRPGGKRRSNYQGIPVVRVENGTLAQDSEQARDRWIRHFARNEGGRRLPEQALV